LLRWCDCNIYLSSMHNSKHKHTNYTGMPAHEDTCAHAHPQYFRMPSHAGAAVLWAQAQGPNQLWHMQSCQ